MAKISSETEIANLALGYLKISPVTSIDPPDTDSPEAQACSDVYDQCRLETLEDHPWNFALARSSIAKDAAAPAFEYDNRFELPSDFVRVARIGSQWNYPVRDYEIIGDFIECDESSPLKLVYVSNFDTVSKFSPKFITALSYNIAAKIAYRLTGNGSLNEAMMQMYRETLSIAEAVDAQNRPTRRVQRSKLREARRNVGRYRDWQSWGDD